MRSSEPPPFGALRATRQFGRAAHCSPFLPAAVAHLYRSSRCRLMVNALVLFVAAALGVKTLGAESSFYQRFQAAEHEEALKWDAHYAHGTPVPGEDMFIQDSSLVDTNNSGPVLTNGPVSYAGFTSRGELAGIKLGMNMSEVVAVWGKPKKLFYYCVPGPHFYYGTGMREELGLHFSGDRLVWIKINHLRAEHATFDNGLTGAMGRAETERLVGAPALRDIEYDLVREIDHDALPADLVGTNIQHWRYIGTYSYRAGKLRTDGVGKLRTDIRFDMTHGLSGSRERIQSIGVYLEWDVEPWQEPVWCF